MLHDDTLDGRHTVSLDRRSKVLDYARQARKLAHLDSINNEDEFRDTRAVDAKFITPLDPPIETSGGKRLPAVPVDEAVKLNQLKIEVSWMLPQDSPKGTVRQFKDSTTHGAIPASYGRMQQSEKVDAPLRDAIPPSRTHPLFPPLPMYGPPTVLRTLQCWFFRLSSAWLSFLFLMIIVAGACVGSMPNILRDIKRRATCQSPQKMRPFHDEEARRRREREAAEMAWTLQNRYETAQTPAGEKSEYEAAQDGEFIPTEGGPDPLVVDVAYYARRVGLDAETFEVQTEDGFIIELWHVFNPSEYTRAPVKARQSQSPHVFQTNSSDSRNPKIPTLATGKKKYPVLMIHGLLQSAGAFCCNDDDSLAFYLAKSGYDVWLGNNRCGLNPNHAFLSYDDPRMWAWNIWQMGVMDLAALISRTLAETGFPKLALIAHSQGTTEVLVALAKEQRPDLGQRISVFCALAPAAYAGPLIGKAYFKFMRLVSPSIFRLIFGIHSFTPLMMTVHKLLPARLYSWMGYHVFSFLFSWSDSRWERDLRDRMFQWAPVYVSAESMRWWLGRECFATQKCILATREEGRLEDKEDEEGDEFIRSYYVDHEPHVPERRKLQRNLSSFHCQTLTHQHHDSKRGQYAWYNEHFPPLALWVCGADDLVDGRRLLRRFDRGREPHVRIVHKKIIEGYEHLDVIWAMDAIEKVGKEIREVIWRTVDPSVQKACTVPVGCTKPLEEQPDAADVPMLYSGGRQRMASISGSSRGAAAVRISEDDSRGQTQVDYSKDSAVEQRKFEESQEEVKKEAEMLERRPSGAHFEDLLEKGNPLEQKC